MVINNNIEESYCSFEVSMLLKEKKFNIKLNTVYVDKIPTLSSENNNSSWSANICSRPTHALAIEWLRVNFKIQLFLDFSYYDGFHYGYKWVKYNGDYGVYWKDNDGESPDGWDTPQQATEETLIYVLQNLI